MLDRRLEIGRATKLLCQLPPERAGRPQLVREPARGGRVVGFMLGEVRGGEFGLEEPTGWVEFFGVDPSSREKGVGRRLIEALLGHFRSKGAHVARTMVATQDKDIAAFIAAMGFKPAPLSALEKRL